MRGVKGEAIQGTEMAGGMDVHKNEWVEAWASHRENLEQKFRFNRRSIPVCLLFGLLTPIFTYQFVRDEFVSIAFKNTTLMYMLFRLEVRFERLPKIQDNSETMQINCKLYLYCEDMLRDLYFHQPKYSQQSPLFYRKFLSGCILGFLLIPERTLSLPVPTSLLASFESSDLTSTFKYEPTYLNLQ